MLNDKNLEKQLLSSLKNLEELNDGVAPTNLRHYISETICRLRQDIKNYDQERDEQNHKLFDPEVTVAKKYIKLLEEEHNVTYEKDEDNPTSLPHLLWMLYEITLDRYMTHTKKNRWLGYVQGCLVIDGVISVDVERKETRHIFNGR